MHDPRQSLRIVNSDSELTIWIGQLARLLGYTHWEKYSDFNTDTIVFRFSVLKDGVWIKEQICIPNYALTQYNIAMPIYHVLWLEISSKLKGIPNVQA